MNGNTKLKQSRKDMHAYIRRIACMEMKKTSNSLNSTGERKATRENMYISILQLYSSVILFQSGILAPVTNTGKTITFYLDKTCEVQFTNGWAKKEMPATINPSPTALLEERHNS